jgi:hypothetical protein
VLVFAGVNASVFSLFTKGGSDERFRYIASNSALPSPGCLASLWFAVSLVWRTALFGWLLLTTGTILFFLMKGYR